MTELTKEEALKQWYHLVYEDCTEAEAQKIYSGIGRDYPKSTESHLHAIKKYDKHQVLMIMAVKIASLLRNNKSQRILDIGAGTGYFGAEIAKHGFNNMDALDPNPELLKGAKEKNIYKNIICERLGDKLSIENETYDAIVGHGLFLPAHAQPDCFSELIRILKPGCLFVTNAAENWDLRHSGVSPYFVAFEAAIQSHAEAGHWTIEAQETIENGSSAGDCVLYICRKTM